MIKFINFLLLAIFFPQNKESLFERINKASLQYVQKLERLQKIEASTQEQEILNKMYLNEIEEIAKS